MLATNFVGKTLEEKFLITELLGEGGMGSVFLATQKELNRQVAIKIMNDSLAADEESQLRFLREGKVLSSMVHSNIVLFYQFGFAGKLPFIAMEYLKGKSLQQYMQEQGALSWEKACNIILQVCAALEYAHKAGVVHRDLKPSNIIIVDEETLAIKVFDFGLATFFDQQIKDMQQLTATGLLIGSVHYMSPEQSLGRKADHRSDIYATACIFYEMLCGHPPFDADSSIGLLHKHANEPVPDLSKQDGLKDCPVALDAVIAKATEKDPEKRYQSIAELAQHIKLIKAGKSEELPEELQRRGNKSRSVLTLFIAVAALLLVLVGAMKIPQLMEKKKTIEDVKLEDSPHSIRKTVTARTTIAQIILEVNRMRSKSQLIEAKAFIENYIALRKARNPLNPNEESQLARLMAEIQMKNVEYPEASETLAKAFEFAKKHPELSSVEKVAILLSKIGADGWLGRRSDQRKNAEELEKVLKESKDIEAPMRIGALTILSQAYESAQDYDKALSALDRAAKESPDDSVFVQQCKLSKADVYYAAKKPEEAQKAILEATADWDESKPDREESLLQIQASAATRGGYNEIALSLYDKLLKFQNNTASSLLAQRHHQRGLCRWYRWGITDRNRSPHRDRIKDRATYIADLKKSEEDWRQSWLLQKEPTARRESLVNLYACQMVLGKTKEAEETMQKALIPVTGEKAEDIRAQLANSVWCTGSVLSLHDLYPECQYPIKKSAELFDGVKGYEVQAKKSWDDYKDAVQHGPVPADNNKP